MSDTKIEMISKSIVISVVLGTFLYVALMLHEVLSKV